MFDFPKLFANAINDSLLVAEAMTFTADGWQWKPIVSLFHDSSISFLWYELQQVVRDFQPEEGGEDAFFLEL